MNTLPKRPANWALEPRGARTGIVLATLDASPQKRTQFSTIKLVTGLSTRTLLSILYSLQNQGKILPLGKGETSDDTVYARVDFATVFPEPVKRVCPFKPRRKRGADLAPSAHLSTAEEHRGESAHAPATSTATTASRRGALMAPVAETDELPPAWLVPRMPRNGTHCIGVARVTHCLVTAADLSDDLGY